MGMPVRVTVRDRAPADLEPAFAWLRWVDATFSPFRADSDVARLARGERFTPHPEVRAVLSRCEALRAETGGCFDAYATGRLDPSGYVKGWAVDRAAALVDAQELCIDAGGDVLVRGGPWRIGIRHPRRRDRLAAALRVSDAAVATSGLYERGPHIVDPRSGSVPRRRAVGDGDRAVARSCGRLRHRRLRHGGGRAVLGARFLSNVRGSQWRPCAHDGGRRDAAPAGGRCDRRTLSRLGSAGRSRLGDAGRVDGVVHQHLARQDLARDPVALRDEVLPGCSAA